MMASSPSYTHQRPAFFPILLMRISPFTHFGPEDTMFVKSFFGCQTSPSHEEQWRARILPRSDLRSELFRRPRRIVTVDLCCVPLDIQSPDRMDDEPTYLESTRTILPSISIIEENLVGPSFETPKDAMIQYVLIPPSNESSGNDTMSQIRSRSEIVLRSLL